MSKQGATVSKVGIRDRLSAWFYHHRQSAVVSFSKLLSTPLQSMMTWLVIAIALALPCSLFLVVDNVHFLGDRWDGQPRATVFLYKNTRGEVAEALGEKLLAQSGVESAEYISPQQALEEFQKSAGFGQALDMLDENPLPPVYLVIPSADADSPEDMASLAESIQALEVVENVQLDLEWVRKLQNIIAFVQRFAWLLAGLLSLGILLTIGNTIRLAIENRREEIIVVKLVGGTDAFVRRPLLYTGLWYGLVGGLVAWVMVILGTQLLAAPVQDLATLYHSDFQLRGLGILKGLALLFASTLLGLLGAWLAVARHLHLIQPR